MRIAQPASWGSTSDSPRACPRRARCHDSRCRVTTPMRWRRCQRPWWRWSSWPRSFALSTDRGASSIRRVPRSCHRSRRWKIFGVSHCRTLSVCASLSNGHRWFSGWTGMACRPWFARACGPSRRVSRRCRSRAGRHRRGGHRKGWTGRALIVQRRLHRGCHREIGKAQIQASPNPPKGFIARAKTGMPIPGERCRA